MLISYFPTLIIIKLCKFHRQFHFWSQVIFKIGKKKPWVNQTNLEKNWTKLGLFIPEGPNNRPRFVQTSRSEQTKLCSIFYGFIWFAHGFFFDIIPPGFMKFDDMLDTSWSHGGVTFTRGVLVPKFPRCLLLKELITYRQGDTGCTL